MKKVFFYSFKKIGRFNFIFLKSIRLFLIFFIISSLLPTYSQICLNLSYLEGTTSQDFVRAGCDKIYTCFTTDFQPQNDYFDLNLRLQGKNNKYQINFLKVDYIDMSNNSIITITPGFISNPIISSSFNLEFDPIPALLPNNNNYRIYKVYFESELFFGNPQWDNPPTSLSEMLILTEQCNGGLITEIYTFSNDNAIGYGCFRKLVRY